MKEPKAEARSEPSAPNEPRRRYRGVVLKNPVRFGARLVDGTVNPHSDANFKEFEILDAARPEFVEMTYTPSNHKPDHGRSYRIWIPVTDFIQLIPDE